MGGVSRCEEGGREGYVNVELIGEFSGNSGVDLEAICCCAANPGDAKGAVTMEGVGGGGGKFPTEFLLLFLHNRLRLFIDTTPPLPLTCTCTTSSASSFVESVENLLDLVEARGSDWIFMVAPIDSRCFLRFSVGTPTGTESQYELEFLLELGGGGLSGGDEGYRPNGSGESGIIGDSSLTLGLLGKMRPALTEDLRGGLELVVTPLRVKRGAEGPSSEVRVEPGC